MWSDLMLMDESSKEEKTQQVVLRLHTQYVSHFDTTKQTKISALLASGDIKHLISLQGFKTRMYEM
ncbi:hypothetical protein Nmel_000581 [Mimus melanotis]